MNIDKVKSKFGREFRANYKELTDRIFTLNSNADAIVVFLTGSHPWNDMNWSEGYTEMALLDSSGEELEEVTSTKTFIKFIQKFDAEWFCNFSVTIDDESGIPENDENKIIFYRNGNINIKNNCSSQSDQGGQSYDRTTKTWTPRPPDPEYVYNDCNITFKIIDGHIVEV